MQCSGFRSSIMERCQSNVLTQGIITLLSMNAKVTLPTLDPPPPPFGEAAADPVEQERAVGDLSLPARLMDTIRDSFALRLLNGFTPEWVLVVAKMTAHPSLAHLYARAYAALPSSSSNSSKSSSSPSSCRSRHRAESFRVSGSHATTLPTTVGTPGNDLLILRPAMRQTRAGHRAEGFCCVSTNAAKNGF